MTPTRAFALAPLAFACCFDPRVGERVGPGEDGSLHAEACSDGGCAVGVTCGQPTDCASGVCRGGLCAAPEAPCPAAFAGCEAYEDWTGPDAGRSIAFPAGGERYSPKCVRVRLGQSVAFAGNFGSHPLRQSCGPYPAIVAPVSTFTSAIGRFGFYCANHGSPTGKGMAGSIEVVP